MYIDRVPNRGSKPTILLRESYRDEWGKVRKRTVANLTRLPPEHIDLIARLCRGEKLVPAHEAFVVERSLPHGHVKAILGTMRKIGFDTLLSSRPCRERNLVMAMVAERLMHSCSKLACTRDWQTTTLAQELGVEDATVDELYNAMDWLLGRQKRIENKLARQHFGGDSLVLYDVTSTYYEGRTCPLAQYGYNRDGSNGRPVIVYGVLTNGQGCPISVDVYPGSTGDPSTVLGQVKKLCGRFGLKRVVLVGDRGMLTNTQIETLKEYPQLGCISALTATQIRELAEQGAIQLSLFDKQNLAEITSPDFPGERLIACYNPLMADERRRKRAELLRATDEALGRIQRQVSRRTRKLMTKAEIGQKVGRVFDRFKMGKHYKVHIGDGEFEWERDEESIKAEEALDGIYVLRTSEGAERFSAENVVRGYKSLKHVERAFRCMKSLQIRVRPIYHRLEPRVRAHVFLCMLAYYVEWHMRRALRGVLFDDECLDERECDPVLRMEPSGSAKRKKGARGRAGEFRVQSFDTLISELGTQCRNTCRVCAEGVTHSFEQETKPTRLQAKVFDLLGL